MNTILAAIDFSDVSDAVVRQASELAAAFGSRLVVLYAEAPEPDFIGYGPGPGHVRSHVARSRSEHRERVMAVAENLESRGLDVEARDIRGAAVETILEQARDMGARLIVLGSHGHGALLHLLLGSVSEGVLKHAACPVLVVPSRAARAEAAPR